MSWGHPLVDPRHPAQQLSTRIIKPLALESFQLDVQRRQRNWVTSRQLSVR